jgi:hypothetical protein
MLAHFLAVPISVHVCVHPRFCLPVSVSRRDPERRKRRAAPPLLHRAPRRYAVLGHAPPAQLVQVRGTREAPRRARRRRRAVSAGRNGHGRDRVPRERKPAGRARAQERRARVACAIFALPP